MTPWNERRRARIEIEPSDLLQVLARHGYLDPTLIAGDVHVVRVCEELEGATLSIVLEGDGLPPDCAGQMHGRLVNVSIGEQREPATRNSA
jgi:hypothetical protein